MKKPLYVSIGGASNEVSTSTNLAREPLNFILNDMPRKVPANIKVWSHCERCGLVDLADPALMPGALKTNVGVSAAEIVRPKKKLHLLGLSLASVVVASLCFLLFIVVNV